MTKVIGSQTDVPDIGDPIVSPWYQDTAKKIVHVFATTAARDAWINPPDGAVCQAPAGTWWNRVGGVWRMDPGTVLYTATGFQDDTAFGNGLFDVYTFGPGTTWSFPVRVVAHSIIYFGFGSASAINVNCDIVALSSGAAVATGPSPQQANIGGAWFPAPLVGSWTVPANGTASFKARINITGMASGVCHTKGYAAMTVTAV